MVACPGCWYTYTNQISQLEDYLICHHLDESLSYAVNEALAGGRSDTLLLQVSHASTRLSDLFKAMEARPAAACIVHWSLRQPSLEEVFLTISRAAQAEHLASEPTSDDEATRTTTHPTNQGWLARWRSTPRKVRTDVSSQGAAVRGAIEA